MIVTILLIAVGIVAAILMQNRLVQARAAVDAGFHGIEVQLKRRHDLVPSLVAAVKGAMAHETALIDRLMAAREAAMAAPPEPEAAAEAEEALTRSLRDFVAYAEDTPEVTATANIRDFQRSLEETEDQISAARRLYNGNVQRFNTLLDAIPFCWLARAMKLQPARYFTLSETEARAVQAVPDTRLT
ncbi:LemA family protein [Pseudooceanicola marinus]|uniref:LemA family protein n=1 Tax=Pseudooceanicola marinus TaxID=396013 RepID=UPI001CD32D86|nr:LemA family protein [Pseudooceanicola marinus]MCA1335154.1 LemA family protein [Pseudooceanicola marinus]